MSAGSLFLKCLELDPTHADAAGNLMDALAVLENGLLPGDVRELARRFPANAVFRAASDALSPDAPSPEGAPSAASAPLAPWRADIEAAIGRRDHAAAIDALERRLAMGGDDSACFNYMGVIAHACGDHAFAAENFRAGLKHPGAEADTVYNLADTLVAMGRAREALELLDHPPALAEGRTAAAEFPASAEQLRHAVERGEVDGTRLAASRDRNQEAERRLRAGAPQEARVPLEEALAADPADFRALNNLGLVAWYAGDADAAWGRFRAALDLRPAWTDALVNGFDAAMAAGRMEEFRRCLDKCLGLRPGHAEAGRMALHIDREGLAIHSCRSFEALEADAAVLAAADKAVQEGRKADAINAFVSAIERRRPRNPQALNGLGIVAFAEKRHVDAYALFEAAVALHPMDQDILVNLWQAAQALRREGDVLPKLKDSLERNPALHDVKAILESA